MRYALTLLSLLALLVALAAAGSAGANRHSAKATFKFCTDPTFPPMEYTTTSGKIIGFDVDMATKLAATWGATAVASKTAFPGLIPALNAKRCDAVISGIFITPDRTKQAAAVVVHEVAPRAHREGRQPEEASTARTSSRASSSPCRRGRSTRSTSRR